ncbi:MAG: hypothetical protein KGO53_07250 [Alphaproteobacteria bacterium]|nr:hypothetical protein [Alphaproteobacteria bacterium]
MMLLRNSFILAIAATLAGCSAAAGLLDPKSNVPSASGVPVGNPLVMPPDLQLATPGATTDAYQPNGPVASATPPATAKPVKNAAVATATAPATGNLYGNAAAPAAPGTGDIFDQYGISKLKPDGTPKTPVELQKELSAAMIKKRRLQNPSYGTIGNIGAIFRDQ